MRTIESNYKKAIAQKAFKQGDVLFQLNGSLISHPSKYTIQIGVSSHLQPDEKNCEWKYVNHSCNPNAFIDTVHLTMKALRDIIHGEEICFNYNTTEYAMASPFQCNCGSKKCYREIKGFKYLSEEDQQTLLPYAAPHIGGLTKKNSVIK